MSIINHFNNVNEWKNEAGEDQYAGLKSKLKQYLPTNNEIWSRESNYDNYPYFKAQKDRQLARE